MVAVSVPVDLDINLYSISDSLGDDVSCEFNVDEDLDVTIDINGYVISEEDYELLERAKQLTDDDWDILATQDLITP